MAGYRHWQILLLYSGDDTYNHLAYFEMRDAVGGLNLATNPANASMSGIGFAGTGAIGDLFVDDHASFVRWQSTTMIQVNYDFGLGGDRELMEVVLSSPNSSVDRMPQFIAIRRSDDGTNWETAWAILYPTWSLSQKKVFTRPILPEACRYWAVLATGIEGATKFYTAAGMEMREIPVDPVVTGSGSAFMTREDPSLPASNAFDGDVATFASSNDTDGRYMLGYDFGAGDLKVIRNIKMRSRQTVNFTRTPSDGCILKSANFQDWEAVADSEFSGLTWGSSELKTIYEAPFLAKDLTVLYGFVQPPATILEYVPDGGIRETWQWMTTVSISYGGKEQRISLRDTPRYTFQLIRTLTDDDDWRASYNLIRRSLGINIALPLYTLMTPLTADSASGTDELYFDPSLTDVRNEEYAILYHQDSETFDRVRVATVDMFGAVLEDPLAADRGLGWYVMPSIDARIPDGSGPSMGQSVGDLSLQVMSMSKRALVEDTSPSLLTLLDGYPILDQKPVATRSLDALFEREIEVIDNGSSTPKQHTAWDNSYFSGNREWLVEDINTLLWWREFAHTVRGRWKPFLLPSFRDDLPIVGQTVVSPDTAALVTTNVDYLDHFIFETYKRIRIEALEGVFYRRVLNVEDEGNGTLTLTLNQDLPGDLSIVRVSYLNIARFNSDAIMLDHQRNYLTIACSIRSIDA